MPVTDSTPDTTHERVNELYWDSDRTVEEIVKELGVSRSALYSAVRPQDAATACPECGDAMVYTNRSNREAHAATCPGCATEAPASDAPATESSRPSDRAPAGPRAFTRWRGQLAAVPRERVAMVGGAAVLGVVLGAFAARAVRELI
jgi:predicted RNA-binding Zn-ribbon protein involved in translation (DUF1610 family)